MPLETIITYIGGLEPVGALNKPQSDADMGVFPSSET
jgi:hypothetical protein